MSARCDLTDLLVDQCSHCRGHDEKPARAVTQVFIYTSMIANFPGRCALDPEHRIEEGDRIGRTAEGWACSACIEDAQVAGP